MSVASKPESVAFFISPHGFGHAARDAAIIEALHLLDASLRFEVFTLVPSFFFEQSLTTSFGYHSLLTDVGLVQTSPLKADLNATIKKLESFLAFDEKEIERLAEQLKDSNCKLVIADISPLGIRVAERAGLPSVLIENFLWGWIYEGYKKEEPRLDQFITRLNEIFNSADYHIQAEPVCARAKRAALVSEPISRKPRKERSVTRKELDISDETKVVMITMGGVRPEHRFLDQLANHTEITFVIPGVSERCERRDNLILLPHFSNFFHPDLVEACDAVVAKLGYSTLSEIFHAGLPFGYVKRPSFRESEKLGQYIESHIHGVGFDEEEFESGAWLVHVDKLLSLQPRIKRESENGAEQIARFLLNLIS
jgi:hypothetical protein